MKMLELYAQYLQQEEKSDLTVEKYTRDVRCFLLWAGERTLSKLEIVTYKEELIGRYAVSSVNNIHSSINSYLYFIGKALPLATSWVAMA